MVHDQRKHLLEPRNGSRLATISKDVFQGSPKSSRLSLFWSSAISPGNLTDDASSDKHTGTFFVTVEHKDIEDANQTLHLPYLKTSAQGANAQKQIIGKSDAIIIDTVSYGNLIPNREYVIKGKLMNKDTGKPIEIDGNAIVASAKIKPKTASGEAEVKFTFDGSKLGRVTAVVFEELYISPDDNLPKEKIVASHKDIKDKDQTVVIMPEGGVATDTVNTETTTSTMSNMYIPLK